MNSITFVLFGKYCPIMDQLGSKDSPRDFQLNCIISYFFTYIYYFMHGSKDWYDGENEKILTFGVHLNKAPDLLDYMRIYVLHKVDEGPMSKEPILSSWWSPSPCNRQQYVDQNFTFSPVKMWLTCTWRCDISVRLWIGMENCID
jgi:hypothetical protein